MPRACLIPAPTYKHIDSPRRSGALVSLLNWRMHKPANSGEKPNSLIDRFSKKGGNGVLATNGALLCVYEVPGMKQMGGWVTKPERCATTARRDDGS